MPARVDDNLVSAAADMLLLAYRSMTNEDGLKIACPMDTKMAKGAIIAALVNALGYPHCILPTGWTEVSDLGAANGA
jgi:hypothetical protein